MWYLQDSGGGNAYGSIELSSDPFTTNPWKKIKGSVEPNLVVQPYDVEVCHRDNIIGNVSLSSDEVTRALWIIMYSLPKSTESVVEYFSLLNDYTIVCARALIESTVGKSLVHLHICQE